MRPKVLMNFAASLDGKIAPAVRARPFVMSVAAEDHRRMLALRARTDAVVIGATNLRVDDPDLTPSRLRVVVTRSGDQVNPMARVFAPNLGGEVVVAHASTIAPAKCESLRDRATLVEMGASEVDVLRLIDWLSRERGCRTVLCEGGGVLAAAFFAARAVDELYLTIVPRVLGGKDAPTFVEGPGFDPNAIPAARIASLERIGEELFLVYEFRWNATEG